MHTKHSACASTGKTCLGHSNSANFAWHETQAFSTIQKLV